MVTLLFLFVYVSIFVIVVLMLGLGITYINEHLGYQNIFLEGGLPAKSPEGFYKGKALFFGGVQTPWLGKAFSPSTVSGFNLFASTGLGVLKILTPFYKRFSLNKDRTVSAYNFKTYVGKGLKDDKQVIKLDYSLKENPLFIRLILDEIVWTDTAEFLGKVHLKIFPGFYVTVGYFSLRQDIKK